MAHTMMHVTPVIIPMRDFDKAGTLTRSLEVGTFRAAFTGRRGLIFEPISPSRGSDNLC